MAYYTKGTAPAPNPTIWDPLLAVTDGLGGGMLDTTELDATRHGGYLLKGCPMYLDFATKVAHPVKSATVINGGTTTVPFVNKNHLFKVGDIGYVSGSAATITAIDTITSASYDVITFDGPVAGATAGAIIIGAGAVSTVAPVKGIYTLTIGTVPAVDDVLTVNGTAYTFATAAADGKIAIGADKVATAANLQDVLEADNQDFVTKANGATIVFTQKVAGVGAIPTISVTLAGSGTLVASIATTLAGKVGVSEGAKYTANCLLGDTTKIVTGATAHLIFRINQWVNKALIPHTVSALSIESLAPNIIIK